MGPSIDAELPPEVGPEGRHLPVAALATIVLVLIAAVLSLAFRSNELSADLPVTEDAYYAFSVASNIAHGNGVTIDGHTATNGFQPLFTLVTVPLFVGNDPYLSVRLVTIVQVGLFVLSSWVLGLIVRDAVPIPSSLGRRGTILLVMALYLSASFAMRTYLNGLETGFVLLLYTSTWLTYQRRGIATNRDAVILGALFGILVLARIDAAFVAAVFAGSYLVRHRGVLGRAVRRVAIMAATALAVSSPWWLYNAIGFGSLLPTSGAAQQLWASDLSRLNNLIRALAQVVAPWVYFGDRFDRFWPIAMVLVGGGVTVWHIWARRWAVETASQLPPADQSGRLDEMVIVFLIAGGVLAIWYGASSWAVHFYPRYLSPLVLPAVVLWARLALAVIGRVAWAGIALVGAAAVLAVGYTLTFHVDSMFSGSPMWRDQVPLVERTVPSESLVAAGQSGTLGYFRDRVLNLDGKVNSEAYAARADIPAYLASEGIQWFCDWPAYIRDYFGEDPSRFGWVERASSGEFKCLERTR